MYDSANLPLSYNKIVKKILQSVIGLFVLILLGTIIVFEVIGYKRNQYTGFA